jgi:hypothetical protein
MVLLIDIGLFDVIGELLDCRLRKHEYLIWIAASLNFIQICSIKKAQYLFVVAIERFVTYDIRVGGLKEVVTVVFIHDQLEFKRGSKNIVLNGKRIETRVHDNR